MKPADWIRPGAGKSIYFLDSADVVLCDGCAHDSGDGVAVGVNVANPRLHCGECLERIPERVAR